MVPGHGGSMSITKWHASGKQGCQLSPAALLFHRSVVPSREALLATASGRIRPLAVPVRVLLAPIFPMADPTT